MSLLATLVVNAVALAQAQEPDFSAKVTYETPAVPISRALREIGAKAKVRLETNAALGNPVVVVSVKDVPLKELMDRLAAATSGEWKQEEGTVRLIRSAATQNREAAEEFRARVEAVRNALRQVVDSAAKTPADPGPGAGGATPDFARQFGFGGPAARALGRLAAFLDPAALAAVPSDGRIVYSTTPTRMQKPLSGNTGPVFADLIAEHNKAMASKREPTEPESEEERQLSEFLKAVFGDRESESPITQRPAKALLIASRQTFGMGLSLELRLYSPQGKVLLSGNQPLMVGDSMFGDMEGLAEVAQQVTGQSAPARPSPAADDKVIEYSPLTKELTSAFGGLMQGSVPKFSPELEFRLVRPDQYDPLSFGPSESLLAVGKAMKLSIVANLPDDMVSFFRLMAGGAEQTVKGYLQELQQGRTAKAEIKDGWLIVRPAKPDEARKERLDRVALAQLIAASRSKGNPSLDDLAAYAQKAESPLEQQIAMTYLTAFAPSAMGQGMGGLTDWNMLRLYGTLSMGQKDTLLDRSAIPLGNLSPAQKQIATNLLFGANARLQVREPGEPPKEEFGFVSMIRRFMPGSSNDYRQEPTEAMPMGLPGKGALRLDLSTEVVGIPVGSSLPRNVFGVLGADELAMLRYLSEEPAFAQFGAQMPRIEGLRLGRRTAMRFVFTVAPNVTVEHTLNDDRVAKDATTVAIADLTPEMKARIEERLAQLKKNPLPFGGLIGSRQNPPPN